MDTIATILSAEPVAVEIDGQPIPIVVGFNPDGSRQTLQALADRQRRAPIDCAHTGASWSSCLALRCPLCGARMFLPPALLKYLPAATITAMEALWSAAGWPEWRGLGWRLADPAAWTLVPDYKFRHCAGGLPVRTDRMRHYQDMLAELAA